MCILYTHTHTHRKSGKRDHKNKSRLGISGGVIRESIHLHHEKNNNSHCEDENVVSRPLIKEYIYYSKF